MALGIFDGKTVKGPLEKGDGTKSSYIGKTGWPSWAGKTVLSTDGYSFGLDGDEMYSSESDGYLVDRRGGICHLFMENRGGSNIDGNMYFFLSLKTVLKLNAKFRINGLRGVPKNGKELFLLAQLCHVCHYSQQVADEADSGKKDIWNNASDTMKDLAFTVYAMHNGSGYAKKLFPQGAKTIIESSAMSWKEIIEGKIEQLVMSRLKNEEDSEYQEFFQKCLKKFGVESPAELEGDAKKKEFFDYVDQNWKGDNEKAEGTEAQDSISPEKKKKLAASNCGS